jgi:stage V sporulation protein AC
MNEKEYKKIVKSKTAKENKIYNMFIAFFIGGLMGVIGQLTSDFFYYVCDLPLRDSYMYTMIFLVIIASILTGFGIFDKVTSFAKAGLLVPTTGFAHAMTSAAMDYRKEGLIRGIGGNIFKLTGSIILYGVVISFFVALIKGVLS